MGSRFNSHQLSNGLYVSGRPEQCKERQPTMTSTAVPYTGGDIKKSGEIGKMLNIPVEPPKLKKSGPAGSSGVSNSGPLPSHAGARAGFSSSSVKSNSGPLGRTSGDLAKKSSGPLSPSIPATGLITSGPVTSGPLNSSRKASGPLDASSAASFKLHSSTSMANNQAVTNLSHEYSSSKRNIPRVIFWVLAPLFLVGFMAGGFITVAVHNAILLLVVTLLFGAVLAILVWNACQRTGAVISFLSGYSDRELREAKDGQYVKVTGVVTCGTVPLESSYEKASRCVYTSTGLYEYRGWDAKPANAKHRRFTWGLRYSERYVTDFYISDLHSGFRALVKAGYGARVASYVDETTVIDITSKSRELSSDFIRWLGERNLSSDERIMRLKEGYIKEGSTVSVMGVVRRNDNVLMIVPPPEPISTGCQWRKFLLPSSLEGIVLRCEDSSTVDVISV